MRNDDNLLARHPKNLISLPVTLGTQSLLPLHWFWACLGPWKPSEDNALFVRCSGNPWKSWILKIAKCQSNRVLLCYFPGTLWQCPCVLICLSLSFPSLLLLRGLLTWGCLGFLEFVFVPFVGKRRGCLYSLKPMGWLIKDHFLLKKKQLVDSLRWQGLCSRACRVVIPLPPSFHHHPRHLLCTAHWVMDFRWVTFDLHAGTFHHLILRMIRLRSSLSCWRPGSGGWRVWF